MEEGEQKKEGVEEEKTKTTEQQQWELSILKNCNLANKR